MLAGRGEETRRDGPGDDRLPDDAIVVRGGVMEPRQMEINAYTTYDDIGEYALSVCSLPDADLDEILRVGRLRNGQVRVSTAGRIRKAGYEVVRSEPPPAHADLKLGRAPTSADWVALRDIFDPPVPNSHRRTD